MSKRTDLFIEFNKELEGSPKFFGDVLFGLKKGKYSINNPIYFNPLMKSVEPAVVKFDILITKGLFRTNADQYVQDPNSPEVLEEFKKIILEKNRIMIDEMLVGAGQFEEVPREDVESMHEAFAELINECNEVTYEPARTTMKFSFFDQEIDMSILVSIKEAIEVLRKTEEGIDLKRVYLEVHESKVINVFEK